MFLALSGKGDKFVTVEDFIASVREGVYLDQSVIPSVPLPDSTRSDEFLLNSYVYDYYMNGSLETLRILNGVNNGEAFQYLKEFLNTLQNITKIAHQRLAAQGTFQTIKVLTDTFSKQFQRLIQ